MLKSPDEDEPRLVYADVLQERGDDRGEFIPLQCELVKWATRADPQRFAAMRAREGELLSEFGPEWIEQAIPFHCVGFFHRGFVEELQCLAGDLLDRGLEVVAPVRVLRLDGDTSAEVAQRVMALPMGSKVKELTLRLVDSEVDTGLRSAGAALTVFRQLSPEGNTIELLDQLGWLGRLTRLELPLTQDGAALLDDIGIFGPQRLEQLWLQRQGDGLGREVLSAVDRLWGALPALTIRWRGIDYQAADAEGLMRALAPQQAQQLMIGADARREAVIEELVALPAPRLDPQELVITDPPEAMELVPLARPVPSTTPWDRWLKSQRLVSRGFLPRAQPQSVTVLRVEDKGAPVLVALSRPYGLGGVPFAEDIARLMALPRDPFLLRVERTAMLEQARWAVFESFEGVSLWELMRLHPRLPPAVVLRVLGQTAHAASKVDSWLPSTDDVLLDVLGRVRLLPGFPRSVRAEEPSKTGREERHPLGAPPEDGQAPGARVAQLGTALFELLTGTSLFEVGGRSMLVLAADWYQLMRQLDRGGLSLAKVDPALEVFEPLLAKALSHTFGERFAGLTAFADALELHPQAATQEQLAQLVRDALPKIPRTRDGR